MTKDDVFTAYAAKVFARIAIDRALRTYQMPGAPQGPVPTMPKAPAIGSAPIGTGSASSGRTISVTQAPCGHDVPVNGEEIIDAVDCWAKGSGSFGEFFDRMRTRGYAIMKVKP